MHPTFAYSPLLEPFRFSTRKTDYPKKTTPVATLPSAAPRLVLFVLKASLNDHSFLTNPVITRRPRPLLVPNTNAQTPKDLAENCHLSPFSLVEKYCSHAGDSMRTNAIGE